MKISKIKHKLPKFFGWHDHKWATYNGSSRTRSYKDDYGHFSIGGDDQTKFEKLQKVVDKEHLLYYIEVQ
jgi:hypothetical protein